MQQNSRTSNGGFSDSYKDESQEVLSGALERQSRPQRAESDSNSAEESDVSIQTVSRSTLKRRAGHASIRDAHGFNCNTRSKLS